MISDSKEIDSEFYYLGTITLNNGNKVHLTSSTYDITYGEKIFEAKFGFEVKKVIFTDIGENFGTFKLFSCLDPRLLQHSIIEVKLFYLKSKVMYDFFVGKIQKFHIVGLEVIFEASLDYFSNKLLQVYSKTCRASFGDKRCKVDKMKFAVRHNIELISSDFRKIVLKDLPNCKYMEVYINEHACLKVLHQNGREIILKTPITSEMCNTEIHNIDSLLFIKDCDKEFFTCKTIYNNAINFRGEPTIPEIIEKQE